MHVNIQIYAEHNLLLNVWLTRNAPLLEAANAALIQLRMKMRMKNRIEKLEIIGKYFLNDTFDVRNLFVWSF